AFTGMLALLGSMLLAGLASSLHCIGMCGPILLGFSTAFERTALTVRGQTVEACNVVSRKPMLVADFAWYHLGRIWTYAMLGFAAGAIGMSVRGGAVQLGIERPLAFFLAIIVILSGVVLLDVLPGLRIDQILTGCGMKRFKA